MRESVDEVAIEETYAAIDTFIARGGYETGLFLSHALYCATLAPVITPASLPAAMLARSCACVNDGGLSLSRLMLVATLNRIFCMRELPEALTRPLSSGSPTVSADMLLFYRSYLDTPASIPECVRSQLYLCLSSLIVVQADGEDAVNRLLSLFGGSVPVGGREAYSFTKLFSGCMTVISDRRVAMGPVRRSKERLRFQKNIHLLLKNGPTTVEELKCMCSTISQAVDFLSECTLSEPHNTSPLFWECLSTSPFWEAVIHHLQQGMAEEEVIHAVCTIIRAISRIDDSTHPLLMSALLAVRVSVGGTRSLLQVCRVVIAALESCLETVVLNLNPEHVLYKQLTSDAHALGSALEQQLVSSISSEHAVTDEGAEIVLTVCEGLQALSQTLTPRTAPEMDSTDDPDDYDLVVGDIRHVNEQKGRAMLILRDFLERFHVLLLNWLKCANDQNVIDIGNYLFSNKIDEFLVRYEEVPVALFVTYERLCKLLWKCWASHGAAQPSGFAALASEGILMMCAWDKELAYEALVPSRVVGAFKHQQLLRYSIFVSLVVDRYKESWSVGERELVVSSLTEILKDAVACGVDVRCVVSVSEGLRNLHAGANPALMEALWWGLHLDCGEDKSPRWSIASHLGSLLSAGPLITPLPFDDGTQLILLSHAISGLEDVWRIMDVLRNMEPDVYYSYTSADRVALWLCGNFPGRSEGTSASNPVVSQYAAAVEQWSAANPLHFRVSWKLVKPLCADLAAGILANSLEMFCVHITREGGMNWVHEDDYFSSYVLDTLAHSVHATCLLSVLLRVMHIQPTNICERDAPYRLFALARGGNALLGGARCPIDSLFELFCGVADEYRMLERHLAADTINDDDDNGAEEFHWEQLLRELSKFGKVTQLVPAVPRNAPRWLHTVRCAVDEFEVARALRER